MNNICLCLSQDKTWYKVKWPKGWIIVEIGVGPRLYKGANNTAHPPEGGPAEARGLPAWNLP